MSNFYPSAKFSARADEEVAVPRDEMIAKLGFFRGLSESKAKQYLQDLKLLKKIETKKINDKYYVTKFGQIVNELEKIKFVNNLK